MSHLKPRAQNWLAQAEDRVLQPWRCGCVFQPLQVGRRRKHQIGQLGGFVHKRREGDQGTDPVQGRQEGLDIGKVMGGIGLVHPEHFCRIKDICRIKVPLANVFDKVIK